MAAKSTQVSMKLLVDKKNNKVLFAEATKEVVDFLFNILSLPVATVVRLLTKQQMVGCLSNLYESIESLSGDYIQPNQNKDNILKQKASIQVPLLSLNDVKTYYRCSSSNHSHGHIPDIHGTACPSCRGTMTAEVTFVGGSAMQKTATAGGDEGGFVKGVVTYMVMDDLVVQPMSTIYSITLLNKFNVKEVGSLEEKLVNLDMAKGVKLLKESMQSKSVLTNVLLSGQMT